MSKNEERWRPIKGFHNYEISDHGRARHKDHGMLRPNMNSRSVPYYSLYDNGRQYSRGIAKLVAMHYVSRFRTNPGVYVVHLDGNKMNNHYENLVWRSYHMLRWFHIDLEDQEYLRLLESRLPQYAFIENRTTRERHENMLSACRRDGVLPRDLWRNLVGETSYVMPTRHKYTIHTTA